MPVRDLRDLFPSTPLFDFFISWLKRGSENREWSGLRSVKFEESPDSKVYRSG